MPKYLFSFGDSSKGPVGACIQVLAADEDKALEVARDQLNNLCDGTSVLENDHPVEYFRAYFNGDALSKEHIEQVESAVAILGKNEIITVSDLHSIYCPECEHAHGVRQVGKAYDDGKLDYECPHCNAKFVVDPDDKKK